MQKNNVDLFQNPSPKAEKILYTIDKNEAFIVGVQQLLNKESHSYQGEELIRLFEPIWKITSPIKHLEILVESEMLDWQDLLKKMRVQYKQFIWLQVKVTKLAQNKVVYFFDFIPLAKKYEGFPIEVNLEASLEQMFGFSKQPLKSFVEQIEQIIVPHSNIKQNDAYTYEEKKVQNKEKVNQSDVPAHQQTVNKKKNRAELQYRLMTTRKEMRGMKKSA